VQQQLSQWYGALRHTVPGLTQALTDAAVASGYSTCCNNYSNAHLMTPNLKRGLSLPCPSMLLLLAAAATTRSRCRARG
jgi:hypothetical protein